MQGGLTRAHRRVVGQHRVGDLHIRVGEGVNCAACVLNLQLAEAGNHARRKGSHILRLVVVEDVVIKRGLGSRINLNTSSAVGHVVAEDGGDTVESCVALQVNSYRIATGRSERRIRSQHRNADGHVPPP